MTQTTLKRETVDIAAEADDLRGNLADLAEEIDEKVAEAMALDPNDEDDAESLARVEAEYDDLEAARVTLEGYVDVLNDHAEKWDGTEIVVRELSGSEVRMVQDEVSRDAAAQGFDSPPAGLVEVRMAEKFVEQTPPGAPDPSDIGNLPDRLFSWLYGRGNALNTVGKMNLGNLSLQERMTERRS